MARSTRRTAGLRLPTADGALLLDPSVVDAGGCLPSEAIFDPGYWAARGECAAVAGGRGAAWYVGSAPREWVLRHYRRGGLVARLTADGYAWGGEPRVRAFAEWRLLEHLVSRGLPVPQPVGARYRRRGFVYRCDLITRRIAGARSLTATLAEGAVAERVWGDVGRVIRRLHAAGADHADLNAHNVLIDAMGGVSIVDFDRGRLRATAAGAAASPAWAARNLARLHRSLAKVCRRLPPGRFPPAAWDWLLAGYDACYDA